MNLSIINQSFESASVTKPLGGRIDKLLIPYNFVFSKIEENERYLKYTLSSEIDPAKSSIINIKVLFRKISRILTEEKLDLELTINGGWMGYTKLDRKNKLI